MGLLAYFWNQNLQKRNTSKTMRPKIIDTHAHLYSSKFRKDKEEVIARAQEVLEAVFLPNIDRASIPGMHELVDQHPDFFYPAMGLHPSNADANYEEVLAELKTWLDGDQYTYYAIGETGIDLYWKENIARREFQEASLEVQIGWAKSYELPIILHAREATDVVIELIGKNNADALTGVFHCWDGNIDQARKVMDFSGFKMGIGGNVTYRANVQEVVKEIPLEYIVLETDSPYLAPEPYRKAKNRRNESSYTTYVAEKIAEVKGITYEEVAEVTNRNAKELFKLV